MTDRVIFTAEQPLLRKLLREDVLHTVLPFHDFIPTLIAGSLLENVRSHINDSCVELEPAVAH